MRAVARALQRPGLRAVLRPVLRPVLLAAVLAAMLTAVLTLGATPAAADIVVLTSGDFLKVDTYQVGETDVRLTLPFGGTMTLPLTKVVHILDDEILGEVAQPVFDLSGVEIGFGDSGEAPETQYGTMIFEVGRKYDLNPRLLAAIVAAESGFEPWARSSKGAVGLMQVMPATAERFGVDPGQLYDPLVCLDVGARFLTVLRRRYEDDLALMLAAYNAGESTVERFGGVPPYLETQTYIREIERIYRDGPG